MLKRKLYKFVDIRRKTKSNRIRTEYSRRRHLYSDYYGKCKVQKNLVLYEAFFGRGMLCNPHAIFQAFMRRNDFEHFHHLWVINDFEDNKNLIHEFKEYDNVEFIQYESEEYLQALCKAKYLINNSTFQSYFIKKEEQIYINTWHGIPLKTLGFDMPDGNISAANTVRNFILADYLISPNEFQTKMYTDSYRLEGIYNGSIVEFGQPRNDLLFHTERSYIINKLKDVGVKINSNKKIIMYAPTWKGTDFSDPELGLEEYFDFINTISANVDMDEYQVFVKPHQIVYKYIKDDERVNDKFIPATVDTNELLSIVDILVSDYSSIFFDFLKTGKSILFYIPDLDQYKNYRGVYLPVEELPGPSTTQLTDIAKWINEIDDIKRENQQIYDKNVNWVCCNDDGSVGERILNLLLDGKVQGKLIQNFQTEKKKVLVHRGGMDENGITHSFLSLLNCFDYDKYDVTVYVSGPKSKAAEKRILSINKNVRVLMRVGSWGATEKEDLKRAFLFEYGIKNKMLMKIFPNDMFKREFARCFGDIKFDYVVDFSGYSPFFSMLMLQAKGAKKLIWQHNDMLADRKRLVKGKMPHDTILKTVFTLYPYFDKIVSCSKSVMEVNKEKVANPKTIRKFTYAKNTLNFDRITECLDSDCYLRVEGIEYLIKNQELYSKSSLEMEIIKLPYEDNINFVTMGRMSTEKNHIALIKAFAKLERQYPQVRLHIIGDGPLRQRIENKLVELKLTDKVTLTGNISNPFAYMKKCQCFVLPSIHEGQPLVLLEARTLNLPLIISKFSSVQDSLIKNGQYLVEPNEDSIFEGLLAFIEGRVPQYNFSAEQYNQEAYREFERLLD